MALFKCKMCGGSLEVAAGETIFECEFCGTQQTLPKTSDETIQSLFNRANLLRQKNEFDKAEAIYEKILSADETEAEAYWGVILCKYGIEYVEDPKTFKRIPTCHRTSYEAIVADEYYKKALEFADATQRTVYEKEAKQIDEIQQNILAISSREEPYDVFICYKQTDEGGNRTKDSVVANDIYYQLTQEGFKVFYAAVTLEDKLGSAYEPIIFAALNSAKVMLSIGTKPEHFNAVWVKNEWSRFLKMMKTDRSKMLIPCYKEMDAYELPEEFAHLQAQDMGKIGFINDIVRGIKKVIVKDEPKATVIKETVVADSNTAPLLKRAFMFLEDGDWNSANEYCEKVLDLDPECAEAYVGKLMVELRVKTQESLKDLAEPFDNSNNYQKALRFGDEKLKGYIDHINTRNETARKDGIYHHAKEMLSKAKTENAYKEVAHLFESISEYMDAVALAQKCYEKAEAVRKDAILSRAETIAAGDHIEPYKVAIKLLESIYGWKDTDERIAKCQKAIENIQAKVEAERLEQERLKEVARKKAIERAKRTKKIVVVVTPIICAIITFVIIWNAVIIPNGQYNDAIALMDAGNVVDAYKALIALDGYRDSEEKVKSIFEQYKAEVLKQPKIGDYIFFGTYEQDNNASNGKEDIEWLVLEVKDGKALVISKYALDCKPFNTSDTNVTWETCTLRNWLNSDFINSAFTSAEKAMIPIVTVSADNNPHYGTNPGNATQDQVFLLSINETDKYFNSNSARECKPTDYAVDHGARLDSANGNGIWWLRSPGYAQHQAGRVSTSGSIDKMGSNVNTSYASVRPALWIDLSKVS